MHNTTKYCVLFYTNILYLVFYSIKSGTLLIGILVCINFFKFAIPKFLLSLTCVYKEYAIKHDWTSSKFFLISLFIDCFKFSIETFWNEKLLPLDNWSCNKEYEAKRLTYSVFLSLNLLISVKSYSLSSK